MPQTKVIRGFCAPCIRCGSDAVNVSLRDLSEFVCPDCDETFDAADVTEMIESWTRVLAWLQTAPTLEAK